MLTDQRKKELAEMYQTESSSMESRASWRDHLNQEEASYIFDLEEEALKGYLNTAKEFNLKGKRHG